MLLRSVLHPHTVAVMTVTRLTFSFDKRSENNGFICQQRNDTSNHISTFGEVCWRTAVRYSIPVKFTLLILRPVILTLRLPLCKLKAMVHLFTGNQLT